MRVKMRYPGATGDRSVLEQNSSLEIGLQDVVRRAAIDDEAEIADDHGSVTTLNDPKSDHLFERKTHGGDAGNPVRGTVVFPSAIGEGGSRNITPEVVRNVIA